MSNPEPTSQELNNIRKSKRQRVPNQYYTKSIVDPKKQAPNPKASNNNRNNRNNCKIEGQDDYSYNVEGAPFDEKYAQSAAQYNLAGFVYQTDWIPCKMKDNRSVKLRVIFDVPENIPEKNVKIQANLQAPTTTQPASTTGRQRKPPTTYDGYSNPHQGSTQTRQPKPQQTSYQQKPLVLNQSFNSANSTTKKKDNENNPGVNLLSLFSSAIETVKEQEPSNSKNQKNNPGITQRRSGEYFDRAPTLQHTNSKNQQNQKSGSKPIPTTQAPPPVLKLPPKRVAENDQDGKILGLLVEREQKVIKIQHSRLGKYEVPIDAEKPSYPSNTDQGLNDEHAMENEEKQTEMESLRRKIENNLDLFKSVPLFN